MLQASKEPGENSVEIISVFSELLDMRNIAGYNLGRIELDEKTAKKAHELINLAEKYIETIGKTL